MRNFKKIIHMFCILAVAAAVFILLDFLLYPCTFTRNDIHTVITERYDDLYLGTSHGKMGIDPEIMEEVSGRSGHNLCVGGQYSEDAYYLARLILEKGQKPSRIIYEISPWYYTMEKEEGNNYLLFYHEFPLSVSKLAYFRDTILNCNFRTLFFPWYEYSIGYELEHLTETVRKKWTGDYGVEDLRSDTQEYHESGFVERYPVDTSTLTMEYIEEFHESNIKKRNMDYLDRLIALCREHDIEFIALVTPMPEDTLMVYGDSYAEAYQYFGDYFAEQDVRYINFNSDQYYDVYGHELELFTDYDGHMNGDAAREFSRILAQILDNTYEFPQEEVPVYQEPEAVG